MYVLKTPDQHLLIPVGRADRVDVRQHSVQPADKDVHLACSIYADNANGFAETEAACKQLVADHGGHVEAEYILPGGFLYVLPATKPPTSSASSDPGISDAGSISIALRRPFQMPADAGTVHKSAKTVPRDFKQYAAALQATVLDNERSAPRAKACSDELGSAPKRYPETVTVELAVPSIELPGLDSAVKLALCDSGVLQFMGMHREPRLSTADTEWESVEDDHDATICEDDLEADRGSSLGSSCSGMSMEVSNGRRILQGRSSSLSSRCLRLRKVKAKIGERSTGTG